MKTKNITTVLTRCMSVACMLAAVNSAVAQSVIYGTPEQPLVYNAAFAWDNMSEIHVSGGISSDFTLISSSLSYTAGIAPQGNNRILGTSVSGSAYLYLAVLTEGNAIGSSLDPANVWYDQNTDQYDQAIVGYGSEVPRFQMAFVGLDLYYDGDHHYGWLRISNPYPFVAGQIVDWAYETTPNTPILAGAVPEPGVAVLFGMSAFLLIMAHSRKRALKVTRQF